MSTLAFVNIPSWVPEQVANWFRGLDDVLLQYVTKFLSCGVTGKQLLCLTHQDLDNRFITKLGHQELILEAVTLLRCLHFDLERENMQSLALRLGCKARGLYSEINARTGDHHYQSVVNGNLSPENAHKLPIQTLRSVSEVITSVKDIVSWFDRPPFDVSDEFIKKRNTIIRHGMDMIVATQSDNVAHCEDTISNKCLAVAELCDIIITQSRDPLVIQPAALEIATIRKKPEDELGMHIQSSYNGTHTIGGIKEQSPADICGKIEEGDEVIQVNYQTVIGWQLKKLVAVLKDNTKEVTLTLKKRPHHTSLFGNHGHKRKVPQNVKQSTFPKAFRRKSRDDKKARAPLKEFLNSIPPPSQPFSESARDHDSDIDNDNDVFRSGSTSPAMLVPIQLESKQRRATVSGASPPPAAKRSSIEIDLASTGRPKSYTISSPSSDGLGSPGSDLMSPKLHEEQSDAKKTTVRVEESPPSATQHAQNRVQISSPPKVTVTLMPTSPIPTPALVTPVVSSGVKSPTRTAPLVSHPQSAFTPVGSMGEPRIQVRVDSPVRHNAPPVQVRVQTVDSPVRKEPPPATVEVRVHPVVDSPPVHRQPLTLPASQQQQHQQHQPAPLQPSPQLQQQQPQPSPPRGGRPGAGAGAGGGGGRDRPIPPPLQPMGSPTKRRDPSAQLTQSPVRKYAVESPARKRRGQGVAHMEVAGNSDSSSPRLLRITRIESRKANDSFEQEKRDASQGQPHVQPPGPTPAELQSQLQSQSQAHVLGQINEQQEYRPTSVAQSYTVNIVGGVPQRVPISKEAKEAGNQSPTSLLRKKHFPRRFGAHRRISCKDLGHGDCQGWLFKKKEGGGRLHTKWVKRWFILKEKNLYYYKDQEDDKAQGVIHLPGFQVSPAVEIKSKKFAFKAHHSGTTFYFAAERQDDMGKWMNKMGLAAIVFDASHHSTIAGFNKKPEKDSLSMSGSMENLHVGYYSESDEESDISSLASRSAPSTPHAARDSPLPHGHTLSPADSPLPSGFCTPPSSNPSSRRTSATSCRSDVTDNSDDFDGLYRKIKQADLAITGHDQRQKRASTLNRGAQLGERSSKELVLSQKQCSLIRSLREKERELTLIESVLSVEPVASVVLSGFRKENPDIMEMLYEEDMETSSTSHSEEGEDIV